MQRVLTEIDGVDSYKSIRQAAGIIDGSSLTTFTTEGQSDRSIQNNFSSP